MGPILNMFPCIPSQLSKNLGLLLVALIVALLPGFFDDLPDLARREQDFFRVSVLVVASDSTFIEVSLESLGSMVVSVCNLTIEFVDAYTLSYLFNSYVESTFFYLSVNYKEMISCIVSTWRIMRSRSKYIL